MVLGNPFSYLREALSSTIASEENFPRKYLWEEHFSHFAQILFLGGKILPLITPE
jgi:hypothetical protein